MLLFVINYTKQLKSILDYAQFEILQLSSLKF